MTRHTVLAMNTHLDDQGSRSRFEAAKIILQKIDDYRSGDFGDSIAGFALQAISTVKRRRRPIMS
jgi:hypothetical protein